MRESASGNVMCIDMTEASIQKGQSCGNVVMYILSFKNYEDLKETQQSGEFLQTLETFQYRFPATESIYDGRQFSVLVGKCE